MLETIINLVMWTFNFVIVIVAGVEIVKQYLLQSRNKHVVIDMDSQGNKLIRLEDGREYWVGYPKTLRGSGILGRLSKDTTRIYLCYGCLLLFPLYLGLCWFMSCWIFGD